MASPVPKFQATPPEYLNQYNGRPLVITAIAFMVLDTIFVLLRFLARHLQRAPFGWDDWLIIPGWLFILAMSSVLLVMKDYGIGRHTAWLVVLHPELLPTRGALGFYVVPILYVGSATFPKLSILVLYLRIFTDRFSRATCWALCGIISTLFVVNVFVICFQCSPRSKVWTPQEPGHCHNVHLHFTWGSFPNWVTDFVMLVLPLPVIYRLHAKLRVKVGLMLTFMTGSLGMITAIIRWTTFFNAYWLGVNGDQLWHNTSLHIWNIVEPSIYLLSACMLAYRALFRNIPSTGTIYSWLKSPRSHGSYAARTMEEGTRTKRQFIRMGRNNGSSSEDSTGVPFAASSAAHNGVSFAERGEAIELGPIGEGNIQVDQRFELAYPKKALV